MGVALDFLARQVPSGPKQEVGIGQFTAFVRVRDTTKLTAEVPATPVEDGSVLNDHIILKPLTVSIEGDVSDVHLRASPLVQALQRSQAEVGNVSEYLPTMTASQVQRASVLANSALDAARRVDAVIAQGTQVASLFGNFDTTKSLQEQFLDAMEAIHDERRVITIDMPFRHRTDMVITAFTSTTDNTTDSITFTLEAQQIRYASLLAAKVVRRKAAGTGGQLDAAVAKGTQQPQAVAPSLAAQLKAMAGF